MVIQTMKVSHVGEEYPRKQILARINKHTLVLLPRIKFQPRRRLGPRRSRKRAGAGRLA